MKPSAPVSASFTNRPKRVTPEMRAWNASPSRSARCMAISRSTVSRSADMALRSLSEMVSAMRSSFDFSSSDKPALAQLKGAHQRAVDDQIGVAADRRGEMRIAAQVQAEMPEIARPVLGLRLGAQHDLVQKLLVLGADGLGQDAVKLARPVEAGLGRVDADAGQELRQRNELLGSRRVVNAVDQR